MRRASWREFEKMPEGGCEDWLLARMPELITIVIESRRKNLRRKLGIQR